VNSAEVVSRVDGLRQEAVLGKAWDSLGSVLRKLTLEPMRQGHHLKRPFLLLPLFFFSFFDRTEI
jgi:hypothetical protein